MLYKRDWSFHYIPETITNTHAQSNKKEACSPRVITSEPIKKWEFLLPIDRYWTRRTIESPEISENTELNRLVFSILHSNPQWIINIINEELKTNQDVAHLERFHNLDSFFSLVGELTKEQREVIAEVLDKYTSEWPIRSYISLVQWVIEQATFWKNTRSKFWYLLKQDISPELIKEYLRGLINKLSQKVETTGGNQELIHVVFRLVALLKILEFWPEIQLWKLSRNELFYSLGNRYTSHIWDKTIEFRFVRRDSEYLSLGNRYWDCTSIQKSEQVDHVKNIFWTKASWILDPFYQILEARLWHESLIKVHLFLGTFQWEITLFIDAIETSVALREYMSNSGRWEENSKRSSAYPIRFMILEKIMSIIEGIADNTWVQTVLIEEFSNTTWVREWLQRRYSETFFHTHEIWELFDGEIKDNIFHRHSWSYPKDKKIELQLKNTQLQDKWLKPWINSARILKWATSHVKSAIRGI